MEEILYVVVPVCLFFVGFLIIRKKLNENTTEYIAVLEEAIAVEKEYSSRLEESLKKVETLAETHIEANESFEKQRNDAWKRYQAAGILAGNAQAMLLTQLEASVRMLNEYRRKNGEIEIEVNPALKEIVAEFKKEHVS